MKNIGIIFGGKSPEYEVSLQSAYSIISAMNTDKYNPILIGITREGEWFYYDGTPQNIKNNTWFSEGNITSVALSLNTLDSRLLLYKDNIVESIYLDAVFPVLHGSNGEDGKVQGLLELLEIPVIGCGVLASALCMDKYLAHELVRGLGIKCPKGKVFKKYEVNNIDEYCNEIGFPCFVKPVRAGSSFGISKVNKIDDLKLAVLTAFKYDYEIIIEEFIDGFEIGCAILGSNPYIIGEIDEIEAPDGFFDYEEKYNLKTSAIHLPARISADLAKRCKDISLMIYQRLLCKGFARVDCFISKNNEIIFNEVNTIPGFTDYSRFPNMLKHNGYDLKSILNYAIEEAMNDK